jgi:hypothetical protein
VFHQGEESQLEGDRGLEYNSLEVSEESSRESIHNDENNVKSALEYQKHLHMKTKCSKGFEFSAQIALRERSNSHDNFDIRKSNLIVQYFNLKL